jgi:tetratricopeptide (TPR) repeat protein
MCPHLVSTARAWLRGAVLCSAALALWGCQQWDADKLVAKGNEYAFVGNFRPAIEFYTRAIAKDPELAEAYRRRAIALMNINRHAEALPDWDQAIRLNPERARNWYDRAVSHYFLNHRELACTDLEHACAMNHDLACTNLSRHCGGVVGDTAGRTSAD